MSQTTSPAIRVRDILERPVLISRETARVLEGPLAAAMTPSVDANASTPVAVVIDFEGISGVAPSFVDEMIKILEERLAPGPGGRPLRLTITNVPTRLSSKFAAIARGHSLSIEAFPDGSWELRSPAA